MKLLIGADPEFFVSNSKGKIIPAVDMVAGDKYNPLACLRGAMQVDGLALEFNIDPAASLEEFELNMKAVMRRTLMTARKNTGDKKLTISNKCINKFERSVYDDLDEKSKDLGCSVSYNRQGAISIPDSHRESSIRVVGGHVHLGWVENGDADPTPNSVHFRDCARLAEWMDLFVQYRLSEHLKKTLSTNAYIKVSQEERQRKNRYGRWGEFRAKSYGMEYRSLSNVWIHNAELRALVYTFTQEAFATAVKNPEEVQKYFYGKTVKFNFSWVRDLTWNLHASSHIVYEINDYINKMLKTLEE